MKLGEIVRERRKALSLTQEQLADCLGVSAPAVHKWEKGTTYPDITTLPALARVLRTDLNTLLSFQEDLTDEEIARFAGELDRMATQEGYEAAFQHAMDQIHQYPTCEKLIYTTIFYLDGARFLHGVPNPDAYTDRLIPFYESMSHSQTPEIRDAALTMCISYHRNRKDFAQAEELIQSIPSSTIDKEEQLAILYTQQEKYEQALPLWERRILHSATHIQTALMNLMDIALKEGRDEDAQSCAQVYEQVSGLLHMTQWTPYIARLQLAILKKDRTGCLEVLSKVLPALTQPWEPQKSPIYRTLNGGDVTAIAQQLRSRILDDLEHSEEFAFFRGSPEYEQLRPLLENEG